MARRVTATSRKARGPYRKKVGMRSSWRYALTTKLPTHWEFKRSWQKMDVNANAIFYTGYNIKFNELPNFAEFVALFEHYKINKVKLRFFYSNTNAQTNTHSAGYFYYLTDYNDDSNPTSFNQMLERDNCKVARMTDLNGRYFTQTLVPKVSNEIYKTVATTSYTTPSKNPYIDLTNDNGATPHFGFKVGIDQLATGAYLKCIATMYFSCKGLK